MRTIGMIIFIASFVIPLTACDNNDGMQVSDARAFQLAMQGQIEEAKVLFHEIIIDKKKMFGPDSIQLAETYSTFGAVLAMNGQMAEAEPLIRRAVSIWDATDVDGELPAPYVLQKAQALVNLSSVCQKSGEYEEAEALSMRALAIREEVFESDHKDVLTVIYSLGINYQHQGRFAEAESLMSQALQLASNSERHDISEIAAYTYQLARIHQVQGRKEDALSRFYEALELAESAPREVVHGVEFYRSGLAFALVDCDSNTAALTLFEQSLAETYARFGDDSIEYAMRAANLADCYVKMQRFAEALPLLERSISIYETSTYRDHPSVADLRQSLDTCRRESER